LAVFGFGGGEIVAILAIVLLLFGGSKLPSLAKGLGQSIKEFKKASREDDPPAPEPKAIEAKKAESADTPDRN
jgi:sec-independent protein translocase protein TatA